MYPTENLSLNKRSIIDKSHFLSKISDVFETCNHSRNHMIGIYLLEEERFLYFNKVFKNLFGDYEDTLLEKGWEAWFALIDLQEGKWIKKRISDLLAIPCFEKSFKHNYFVKNHTGKKLHIHHEILLQQFGKCPLAVNFFSEIKNNGIRNTHYSQPDNVPYHNKQSLRISAREKEVLHFIADGFSSKQIANFLLISPHTAISHRKRLIEKFEVKNTAQLIKKASKIMEL